MVVVVVAVVVVVVVVRNLAVAGAEARWKCDGRDQLGNAAPDRPNHTAGILLRGSSFVECVRAGWCD